MPDIMTTKELARYLKLHGITVCKYAAQGKIPAIRIGRVWRFDKDAIDRWIAEWIAPGTKEGLKEDEKGRKKGEQVPSGAGKK
jgi:excisionase family DNA binding protein